MLRSGQVRPILGELQRADALMDILPEAKRHDWGFRQFIPAVSRLIETCETVDESIAEILRLWTAHGGKPDTAQRFRDALGFLRGNLWPQGPEAGLTAKTRRQKRERGKHRT